MGPTASKISWSSASLVANERLPTKTCSNTRERRRRRRWSADVFLRCSIPYPLLRTPRTSTYLESNFLGIGLDGLSGGGGDGLSGHG